ncbi:MAG: excinuclease ABC subunit UvrC [Candidatus Woesearchaeota archaeon]
MNKNICINFGKLPKKPGIYQFKNEKNEIIYIGKAKNLNKRIKSYFSSKNQSPKTQILVTKIKDVEVIVVQNETEALLLENNLIKKHSPKYNIVLKDSKTYAYIKITKEEYPRIDTARKILNDGAKYFGPYTDGTTRRDLIKLITQLYKIRICKTLPKKPCLQYHLGLCTAPCINKDLKEKYLENVKLAENLLKGNIKPITEELEKQMREYSKQEDYERAKDARDKINKIESLFIKQSAERIKDYDEDVIVILNESNRAIITIIHISKGLILSKKNHSFDYSENIFQEFIKMYYSSINPEKIPKEIIVNKEFWEDEKEKQAIEEYIAKLKGIKVKITKPERGDKNKLIEIAEENAKLNIHTPQVLLDLKQELNLTQTPRIIECFDASNLGDEHIVVGMTHYKDAKPDKKEYRKFLIKTITKQDDYAAIHEAVYRRYTRLQKENKEMPHLLMIDGGKGQLKAAKTALIKARVDLNLISLAKQNEEIITEQGKVIILKKTTPTMLLLRQIRDATHNFAINYNRKRREMKLRDEFREITANKNK